jgi:hypothetical protein
LINQSLSNGISERRLRETIVGQAKTKANRLKRKNPVLIAVKRAGLLKRKSLGLRTGKMAGPQETGTKGTTVPKMTAFPDQRKIVLPGPLTAGDQAETTNHAKTGTFGPGVIRRKDLTPTENYNRSNQSCGKQRKHPA